ncbi:MAG: GNAT family N-acetyltransferase [Flavobacteriales bacterium]|nr:GNAT family N-acetyltransferase [Flavobacteriales bacterium]
MKETLTIRKALADDVELLYKWSNDELVRKQSFNSNKISFETHCKWFEGKLKDKKSLMYIVEVGSIPASVVRFDIAEENTVIGISISTDYRGKGLGGNSIKIGLEEYFLVNNLPVLASIKKDNIASIKSFEKAGFVFLKDELINGVVSVIYQIER